MKRTAKVSLLILSIILFGSCTGVHPYTGYETTLEDVIWIWSCIGVGICWGIIQIIQEILNNKNKPK